MSRAHPFEVIAAMIVVAAVSFWMLAALSAGVDQPALQALQALQEEQR